MFLLELGQDRYYQTATAQFQLEVLEQVNIELCTVLHTVCNTYYVLHSIVVKRKIHFFEQDARFSKGVGSTKEWASEICMRLLQVPEARHLL